MATITYTEAPDRSLSLPGVLVLALGALDHGLEQSIILPALPSLAAHYSASLIAIAWLATGFLLASIVAVPMLGRLGDVFGKRRLVLVALGAFAAGSLLCAVTDSIALAIAGRVIQGFGAAVAPLTLGLARDMLSPKLLPRAVGMVVALATAGSGVGFLLSGVLVDTFSPAAIFWFLFGFAIALMIGVIALVPETPVRAKVSLDLSGAALLAAGLVALLLAISKGSAWDWTSARIVGLFSAALVLLALFALLERRVREPLVDLGLVVTRPFANAHVCVAAFGFAFFVAIFLVPQIAATPKDSGYGLGLTTTEIGLLLLPTSLAAVVGGWGGGRLVDRVGPRVLFAAGSLAGVAGYVSLALAHGTAFELAAGSAALGLAWGLMLTSIYPVVIRGSSTDKTGVAIAVNVVIRNTSVAVGTQVAFAILTAAGLAAGFTAEDGFTRAFVVAAAGACLALLASVLMPRRAAASASMPL